MGKINIVLVEPEIPQNTGNIARTCAATGAVLHLVKPLGFAIDDKKLKRAGLDYWHQLTIRYYDSLEAFLTENRDNEKSMFFYTTKAKHTHTEIVYPENPFIVFGKETKGLPEALLRQNRERCVRLPMLDDEAARSLNLSNTVAVGVYEVLRQWGFPSLRTKGRLI